jgi:hypothetical protein
MTEHPMTPAMIDRIRRIHDAILASTDPTSELEGDFLDLLDSLAGNEGADARRAAREAVDTYMDDQDGIHEGDIGNDGPPTARRMIGGRMVDVPMTTGFGPDPLRERFPTE